MPEEKEAKRTTLEVTEVKERQPVGEKGAVKLEFKAKVDDKELKFFTFSSRLFEAIEAKGIIEADVITTTREGTGDYEGTTFTDRKVTQIYKDGQPISQKAFSRYQESPERIASIEAQKRADIIAQLWMAGKLKDDDPLVIQMRDWLSTSPSKGEGKAETKRLTPKPIASTKVFQKSTEVTKPTTPTKTQIEQAERDSEELFPEGGTKGLSAEPPSPGGIDMDWLDESLKKLKWTQATFKTWLVSYGRQQKWQPIDIKGTLTEVIGKLKGEQRETICKEIQDRLDLK